MHVPVRATPLTFDIVKAMAAACLRLNRADLAILLLVGFLCFLRTAELLGLRVKDFQLIKSHHIFIIALTSTKTSCKKRAAESITSKDKVIFAIIEEFIRFKAPDAPIYSKAPKEFRREFTEILTFLGIDELGFMPYSLRRGGATWHFAKYNSFDQTVVRGRWQDSKTARIYIDDARATLVHVRLSPISVQRIACLHKDWRAYL